MTHIIKPQPLPDFIREIDTLDTNKLFWFPADIFGQSHRKGDYHEMVKALEEMNAYWLDKSELITQYAIPMEMKDGYFVSMLNKEINYFRPEGD
jgi:hypothetical protein